MNFPKSVLAEARQHADAVHPQESCGVVIRCAGQLIYHPCENIDEAPAERFTIKPQDWCRAEDRGEPVAIVHSHPDASPRPSMADKVQAELHQLPWLILGWEGCHCVLEPHGFAAPLLGRTFHHGVLDCWAACRDWYAREWDVQIRDFERSDLWWENKEGPSLYVDQYEGAGFYRVSTPERGDMLIMRVPSPGRPCYHPNHAAIYLGSEPVFVSEPDSPMFGAGPFIYHHLYGRLAGRDIYGHSWGQRTELILRRCDRPILEAAA